MAPDADDPVCGVMATSAAHPNGVWTFDVLDAYAIDGDTARVTADLGFGAAFRFDLRLMAVSAPELREEGGPAARDAFNIMLQARPLLVTTHRTAAGGEVRSFARWLGNLTVFDGASFVDIGAMLVADGYATETVM